MRAAFVAFHMGEMQLTDKEMQLTASDIAAGCFFGYYVKKDKKQRLST